MGSGWEGDGVNKFDEEREEAIEEARRQRKANKSPSQWNVGDSIIFKKQPGVITGIRKRSDGSNAYEVIVLLGAGPSKYKEVLARENEISKDSVSMTKNENITIALAWTVPDFVVVKEGRRDLGERPTLRETVKPVSLIWINKGDQKDIDKAEKYIQKNAVDYNNLTLLVYPSTEKDVLGKSKKDLMRMIGK